MPAQAAAMSRTQPQVTRGPIADLARRRLPPPRLLAIRPVPCRVARLTERLQVRGRVVRPILVPMMQPELRRAPTHLAGVLLHRRSDPPRDRSLDAHSDLRPVPREALEPFHERRVQTPRGSRRCYRVVQVVRSRRVVVALRLRAACCSQPCRRRGPCLRPIRLHESVAGQHRQARDRLPWPARHSLLHRHVRLGRLAVVLGYRGRQQARSGRGGEGRQGLTPGDDPIPHRTRTRQGQRGRCRVLEQ